MVKAASKFYEFGPFRIDPVRRILFRDNEPVQLTPKAFDIMLVLIGSDGQVLNKDELMRAVWPDTVVEENNLTRNISALRKALGESPGEHRYVVTIPGRGYQFVADLRELGNASDAVLMARHTRSRIIIEEEDEEEVNDRQSLALRSPIADSASASRATEYEALARRAGGEIRPYRRGAVIALGVVLVAGIVFWALRLIVQVRSGSKTPPVPMKLEISNITHTGNAGDAAISSDGKYIAYRLIEAGRQ